MNPHPNENAVWRTMKAVATRDVREEALRQFRDEMSPDFDVDVDGGRVGMMSMEPPSWIQFIAQAECWVQALAGISALFVAEIVKEAAKDTWRARAKIISAIAGAGSGVRKISKSFVALRRRISSRTEIVIGLPIPDEHFGIHLTLTAVDPDELSVEIALFVHYIPALIALIEDEGLSQNKPATGIFLTLLPTAAMEVTWFDGKFMEKHKRLLSLANGSAVGLR